jgi:hypothetical protein
MSGKRSFGAIEKLKSGRYRARYRVDGRWINLQLAAEVPAAVPAELLHFAPGTATRWTHDAAEDWARYAADIALRNDHQP